jgi:hypothetical protein
MLKSLSALALAATLLGCTGWVEAQCPPATIGAYFDAAGTLQAAIPVQNQELRIYVILFAEAPVGGAAWRLSLTSPQFSGPLVGPAGPNCQPPWCSYQDPPFWHTATFYTSAIQLGDPFGTGVRQGFQYCESGFLGAPVLLATIVLMPWADILGTMEVEIAAVPELYDGLVFADCSARICPTVTGLIAQLGATVVETEEMSWGSVKALYVR